jgi:hypothetical protein
MTKKEKDEMQRWCETFREREGRDLSAEELASMLEGIGWPMPKPKTAHELLAKQVAQAEAEEVVYDEVLGDSVGKNICYTTEVEGKQKTLWGELDKATREKMDSHKTILRDQSVGDVYEATKKCMRWNRLHPTEQPVLFDTDFGPDMDWKLNAPKRDEDAA